MLVPLARSLRPSPSNCRLGDVPFNSDALSVRRERAGATFGVSIGTVRARVLWQERCVLLVLLSLGVHRSDTIAAYESQSPPLSAQPGKQSRRCPYHTNGSCLLEPANDALWTTGQTLNFDLGSDVKTR